MDGIKKKQSKILIAVAVAALLIAATVTVVISVSGGVNEYDAHLEMAQKYLTELNYEQAVVELRLAIEVEPNDSMAYVALAEVYIAMGDYENAMAVLEEGYAVVGDAEILEERERIAGEYAELQEQEQKEREQQEQEQKEREQQEQAQKAEEFYEKYAELYALVWEEVLYAFVWDEVFPEGSGPTFRYHTFERYLTNAECEQAYGAVAEQLEQYLADLEELEGLPNELYEADSESCDVDNTTYFTKTGAYKWLADIYRHMGKLEECLQVRTEWAAFCDRPDLVQDGNRGYDEDSAYEYDKYGRVTSCYYESGESNVQDIWTYEEPHDGAAHWTATGSGELWEDDYTYDSEGRIMHRHRVITLENVGVVTIDHEYTFTGNNSYVITSTTVNPNGHTEGPTQLEERFYDEYGKEISP